MSSMNKLRLQHQTILKFVAQFVADLEKETVRREAEILLNKIGQFNILLEEHLIFEDDFLYPALKKRPQENVRDIALRFSIEFGWIKRALTDYTAKWTSPDKIVQSAADFISESKTIMEALQRRIQKEDTELFPLVEKK